MLRLKKRERIIILRRGTQKLRFLSCFGIDMGKMQCHFDLNFGMVNYLLDAWLCVMCYYTRG